MEGRRPLVPSVAALAALMVAFLRPTKLKVLFLAEWALLILFMLARGGLNGSHRIVVASWPFAFYYLVGCTLVALSRRVRPIPRGWPLLACGLGLVVLDQGAKALVGLNLHPGGSLPILGSWLRLVRVHNVHGSWLASVYDLPRGGILGVLDWALTGFLLVSAVVGYRYYTATHRRSFWAGVAFLGLFSALISWVLDMALRGYILDFIGLPGLFAADLKDIWGGVGAMAVIAEGLDNPRLARPWPGWRGELEQSAKLIGDVWRFAVQDLHGLRRTRTTRARGRAASE